MRETEAASVSGETQRGRRRRSGECEARVERCQPEEPTSPAATELRLPVTFKGTRACQRSLL